MKRILTKLSVIILVFVSVVFSSCGGDEYPNEGFFVVGGKTYSINEAKMESVGYDDGYYQLRLTLDNTVNNDFHSLSFLFYSEVNSYLQSAVYTPYMYDLNFEHKFKRGAWYAGDEEMAAIFVGKVRVTKNNDIYTIKIDCEDSNGLGVAGEYKGELKIVE